MFYETPARAAGISWRLFVSACLAMPAFAFAQDIDFTRYLLQHTVSTDSPAQVREAFTGTLGAGRMFVTATDPDAEIKVTLNGAALDARPTVTNAGEGLEVSLETSNHIELSFSGPIGAELSVRVKQRAAASLNVVSFIHFNTNVSDFEKARAFYGQLGFETISGFPDANTVAMAQAIGVDTPTNYDGSQGGEPGGYLLHGELIGLDGFGGGLIDLIEFTIPRDDDPPYASLNHLGMARAVMYTADLAADYALLKSRGVDFIAAPVTRTDGTQFAIFRDLDGTFYELAQRPAQANEGSTGAGTQLQGLGPVVINVSDFERSRAWYEMFGFNVTQRLAATDTAQVAQAMGFTEPFEISGALLTHPRDGSMLEVVQWLQPFAPEPPYPVPVNHLGIHRMAFLTTDIEADVAVLKAQGVQFVSDITPCCSGPDAWGSIVAFYDPDGTVVELAEQPGVGEITRFMLWLSRLFD